MGYSPLIFMLVCRMFFMDSSSTCRLAWDRYAETATVVPRQRIVVETGRVAHLMVILAPVLTGLWIGVHTILNQSETKFAFLEQIFGAYAPRMRTQII